MFCPLKEIIKLVFHLLINLELIYNLLIVTV